VVIDVVVETVTVVCVCVVDDVDVTDVVVSPETVVTVSCE
jgi:hypothetical protein